VGKWHLGQNELAAVPTYRGFDSYFGYLSGAEDYYSHLVKGAYDLSDGTRTAFEFNGTYSTGLWVQKAVDIIHASDASTPFFLYLAFQNVHWPLEAPEPYMKQFESKTAGDSRRQAVCAMAAILDEGVGQVMRALKSRGIYDDTLIVFASDNGGPTNGNEGTWSSNYPMRGGKNTLWEGGTRVVAAVRGPGIKGGVSYAKMHSTDWLPTLLHAASGDSQWLSRHLPPGEAPFLPGDGVDVWASLSQGLEVRQELLLECHGDTDPSIHGNALIVGDWKILRLGGMHPANEQAWHPAPGASTSDVFQLPCQLADEPKTVDPSQCTKHFCLFNVTADPCEYHDLASSHPDVVAALTKRLATYQATAVKAVSGKDCGCQPVVRKGAWRPCDSPDPNGETFEFEV